MGSDLGRFHVISDLAMSADDRRTRIACCTPKVYIFHMLVGFVSYDS